MKKITLVVMAALIVSSTFITTFLHGCSDNKSETAPSSEAVLSQPDENDPTVSASEAVGILIDGEKISEYFMIQYNWYGEEFVSDDSFHKIMMDHYAPKGNYAPYAKLDAEISFAFDPEEGVPSDIKLTQYANTVRSDSGLPYDTREINLDSNENGILSFKVNYRYFKMFYYLLECKWENGNTAKYAFAVENME